MTTENKSEKRGKNKARQSRNNQIYYQMKGTCECKKGKEPKCDSAAKNKGKEVRFMLGTENKDWKTYINW